MTVVLDRLALLCIKRDEEKMRIEDLNDPRIFERRLAHAVADGTPIRLEEGNRQFTLIYHAYMQFIDRYASQLCETSIAGTQ